MNEAYIIMDGQWGSTGKGLIAGYLANTKNPDTVVCNFGPNAGHTYVFDDGREIMTQMLPTGIVSPSVKTVMIGPGAIVDPDILLKELDKYEDLLQGKTLVIHERACLVGQHHKEEEQKKLVKISSTCKGTGAAQASKIMREDNAIAKYLIQTDHLLANYVVSHFEFQKYIQLSEILQIESAQGFELGVNSGNAYPNCTARDITPWQILSDCGIPGGTIPKVYVSMRTYPIRVGNVYDKNGDMIGYSGPVYPDQAEVTFGDLGLPEETTTVTGKVRRIFTWSWIGFHKMLSMVQPDGIFLNFANYMGKKDADFLVSMIDVNCKVLWVGNGPKHSDVVAR